MQANGALGVHRGGCYRSDYSVPAPVVPEKARSSSAGLVARGLWPACVFQMQLRQTQPARCWSSYIRCCPNLGWDSALLTPFTPIHQHQTQIVPSGRQVAKRELHKKKGQDVTLQASYPLTRRWCWELKESLCCSENPDASVVVLMHPPSTCINGAMPSKDSVPFKWAAQIHRAHRKLQAMLPRTCCVWSQRIRILEMLPAMNSVTSNAPIFRDPTATKVYIFPENQVCCSFTYYFLEKSSSRSRESPSLSCSTLSVCIPTICYLQDHVIQQCATFCLSL